MPNCPQCNKEYVQLPRKCTTCMAELDLLVEYVNQLHDGLHQADKLTRSGELADAVWAYLAVLEVEPDNPVARRQVGKVATAVRQFDRTAPGRRWLFQVRGEQPLDDDRRPWIWWLTTPLLILAFAAIAFVGGLLVGNQVGAGTDNGNDKQPMGKPNNQMMGK